MALGTVVFVLLSLIAVGHGQIFDKLYKRLLKRSVPTVPMQTSDDVVNVTFGLALEDVIGVDTETGFVDLKMWTNVGWRDRRLSWKPAKFNQTHGVRIPVSSKLWIPDIQLYNGEMKHKGTNVIVASDGAITYFLQTDIRVRCDVTKKPLVKCKLNLASWTYDGLEVDVSLVSGEGIELSSYNAAEWNVVSSSAQKNVKTYACCVQTYPSLEFTLLLRNDKSMLSWFV